MSIPLLSLTSAQVRITARECEKVASDLGLGSGFRWVLRFPPPLTTGYSQLCCNMAQIQIPLDTAEHSFHMYYCDLYHINQPGY